jgi:hypothetical protein
MLIDIMVRFVFSQLLLRSDSQPGHASYLPHCVSPPTAFFGLDDKSDPDSKVVSSTYFILF